MKVQPFSSPDQPYARATATPSGGTAFEDMLEAGDGPATSDRARSFRESGLFGKAASPDRESRGSGTSHGREQRNDTKPNAKPAAGLQPIRKPVATAVHASRPGGIGPTPQSPAVEKVQRPSPTAPAPVSANRAVRPDPAAAAPRPPRRVVKRREVAAAGIQLRLDEDGSLVALAIAASGPQEIATDAARTRLAAILNEYGLALGTLTINGKDQEHGA